MPSSASRRCASFWAPSCAFLSSGRMHVRDLWPYLPRCGRSGAAVRVLRRWRLSYIPRRDQTAVRIYEPSDGGVLDPSPEGSPARPASWPLWSGTGALVRRRRRGSAAIPLRFTAPAGDQAPAHAALEIRSRRDVEAVRTATGRAALQIWESSATRRGPASIGDV